MKTYPLKSVQVLRWMGLAQVVFLFLMLPLATVCFGAPQTNVVGWSDNFENYTNQTPLIDGTNGWSSSLSGTNSECAIIQQSVKYSGSQAAMLPVDVTLSNRFDNTYTRIVSIEMYVRPQLYDGGTTDASQVFYPVYPVISTNVAAQFFINSDGYFVVGNGTNWKEFAKMVDGADARSIQSITNNTYFAKIQVNLRYKNHTWNLKAWSNTTLMASTYYVNFTSNLNTFSGFDIYNGNSTSYVDDVSVITGRQSKINGVPFDTIQSINGAQPALINGVSE